MDFNIVVPLGGRNTHNDMELRYMLRSIDKNFDFEYKVTILSDKNHKIDWLQNVDYKIVERYYPPRLLKKYNKPHYENYFDTLNKLKITAENNDFVNDILWVYDDILVLKKLDKDSIKTIYAGGRYEDKKVYWDNITRNKWKNTIQQAIQRSKQYGEVYLYETHLPRYYQRDKLIKLFTTYDFQNMDIPYAPATLYYNMFYKKPDNMYLVSEDILNNDVKAGFYGTPNTLCDQFPSKTKEQVLKYVEGKTFVSYNENGMTEPFLDWMHKTFKKKSRFEK
jgi:hypothetical protein